jgi:hypothetical protein
MPLAICASSATETSHDVLLNTVVVDHLKPENENARDRLRSFSRRRRRFDGNWRE